MPAADVPEAEKLIASMASGTEKLAQLISGGRVSEETTEVRRPPLRSCSLCSRCSRCSRCNLCSLWSLCACVRLCSLHAHAAACTRALCYGRSPSHMCRLQVQTAVLADLSKLEGLIAAPTPPVTVPAEFNNLPQLKKRAVVRPSRRCTIPCPAAPPLALLHTLARCTPLPRCSPPHRAVPPHQVEFVAKKGPDAESSSFNVDGNLFKTAVLRMQAPSAHLATPSHT